MNISPCPPPLGGEGSRGKVFTFTKDHLVPNPDPPTVMVSADLEGGGRFYAQLTECDPAAVGFEMPVELCFRRIHEGEGLINYFWKFRPALWFTKDKAKDAECGNYEYR